MAAITAVAKRRPYAAGYGYAPSHAYQGYAYEPQYSYGSYDTCPMMAMLTGWACALMLIFAQLRLLFGRSREA